ncbi:MAG: PD40 domain-containing protein [Anaerolineae bacterium]|nr:PD40 domain-containing protein [Anaerolineae bacterium]
MPDSPDSPTSSNTARRGSCLRWLVLVVLAVLLAASALAVAAVLGMNRGRDERQAAIDAKVTAYIAQGMDYIDQDQPDLAVAELQQALALDPGNQQAQQALDGLAFTSTATPSPIPSVPPLLLVPPDSAPVTPAADQIVLPTEQLFSQAQAAKAAAEWSEALALLDQLEALDPAFQPDDVSQLRFETLAGEAKDLLADDRYEEALRIYDRALELRSDAALSAERDLVSLYIDALSRWRLDWEETVQYLGQIYETRPDFLDVRERLAVANESWADSLGREGHWCEAVDQYKAAVNFGAATDVASKQAEAVAFCANPPTPTVSAEPDGEEPPSAAVAEGAGQLTFATYSPQFDRWSVYSLAMRGSQQPVVIMQDASQPVWSADGKQVAARSERNDQTGLTAFSSSGANRRRLTTFFEDSHPNWSPDGGQITFESNREGDRRWRIYRVSSGGTGEVFMDYGRWPAWSPDGSTIAYQTCDSTGGRCGLFLVNADGSNPRPITSVPGDAMPAWSPDGSRIAFASAERGGGWDVYLLDVRTGNVSTLVSSPGVDAHPTWSPDGRQVAFLSNRDGVWAVYVTDVSSGQSRLAAVLPDTLPNWYEARLSWGR